MQAILSSSSAFQRTALNKVVGTKLRQRPRSATRISTMASKRAVWEGATLAEAPASDVKVVENNVYFPPTAIKKEYLEPSSHTSVCGWKGTASYYDVVVSGKKNPNAAWYYANTKDAAKEIEGYVAFWKGVKVE
jgi:uncharacterized protein (DUF427 family)